MKRVFLLISALVLLVIIGAAGAAFVMSDSDLEEALKSVPGADAHSAKVVDAKHGISSGIANWFDDQLYFVKSTWRDVTGYKPGNRTPRVVIELEPVRGQINKSKPPATPATTPPEPTAPVPMKLTPPPPAVPVSEDADTSGMTPEKMEPVKAEPATVPELADTSSTAAGEAAAKQVAPEKAVEPKPEPVKKVAEVAAMTPKAKPAPPPAAPKTDDGATAHKKGLSFYKGVGEAKNFKTARKWFEEAAKKGHAAAQYNLGIMSYLGQGTEQDYLRASEWFRMAAEQDHALAQYNLGFLYYGGKGVEKDDLQAFMWIDRAAGLGDEKAIKARDTLTKILPKEIFKKK